MTTGENLSRSKALLFVLLLTGCSSTPPPQPGKNGPDLEVISHPRMLQRHLARDVKESGPDMQSTYSGFLDDGRVFVATQDDDVGTCMVIAPEDAPSMARLLHVHGTVEPIFLVQYDDGHGGSYWEISQDTRDGDVNFMPGNSNEAVVEQSCEVRVVFH